VIISSRPGSFEDRVAMTDAFGHYAVRLPDGDWDGEGRDAQRPGLPGQPDHDRRWPDHRQLGRNIPSLIITR